MKKYKLVNGEDYVGYVEGNIYSEQHIENNHSTKDMVEKYPEDWEEVVEEVELPKKFKLVNGKNWKHFVEGQIYNADYYHGLTVEYFATKGLNRADWEEVFEKPIKTQYIDKTPEILINWIADIDWDLERTKMTLNKEVTEQACVTIFTDAEVVTLITFLNDNFEDFRNFVEWTGSENLAWTFYNALTHDTMNGEQASLLIDKIEKNDTNLTEAEKVTIITFLNDNFEDFKLFTEEFLDYEFYEELDFDGNGVVCPLIDKIEKS